MLLQSKTQIIYHSRWVIAECPKDIMEYYWNWIFKEKGIRLHKPRFGSHISIIRGDEEFDRKSNIYWKYHEEFTEFNYDNNLQTNGDYWWLPIHCSKFEMLRHELGLSKTPKFGFHLTIGREMNQDIIKKKLL